MKAVQAHPKISHPIAIVENRLPKKKVPYPTTKHRGVREIIHHRPKTNIVPRRAVKIAAIVRIRIKKAMTTSIGRKAKKRLRRTTIIQFIINTRQSHVNDHVPETQTMEKIRAALVMQQHQFQLSMVSRKNRRPMTKRVTAMEMAQHHQLKICPPQH